MIKRNLALATAAALALSAGFAAAADPTDAEILAKVDQAHGDASGATWKVAVSEGTTTFDLNLKTRGTDFLAEYTAPAKQKGEKLLMHERDMWFIKPGVAKPTPISPRQKLLGGASYGDLAATAYSTDYTAKRMPDEGTTAVFELTAKNKKVTYDGIKLWVDKTGWHGVKAEYRSATNKTLKTATFEYGNKAGGRDFVSKMSIDGGKTTLTYSDVSVTPVEASTFSLQNVQ